MGRPKRLYPLGKYRLRTPKEVDKDKAYPVELEYTWNRQIIRKTTNVFVKVADWNQNGNLGRGEIRASHGNEAEHLLSFPLVVEVHLLIFAGTAVCQTRKKKAIEEGV